MRAKRKQHCANPKLSDPTYPSFSFTLQSFYLSKTCFYSIIELPTVPKSLHFRPKPCLFEPSPKTPTHNPNPVVSSSQHLKETLHVSAQCTFSLPVLHNKPKPFQYYLPAYLFLEDTIKQFIVTLPYTLKKKQNPKPQNREATTK